MKEEKYKTQVNQNIEQEENEKESKENKSIKKIKTRVILVLIFMLVTIICSYVSYRGNYLETMEIGENFKQVFFENLKYQYGVTFN